MAENTTSGVGGKCLNHSKPMFSKKQNMSDVCGLGPARL